MKGLIKAVIGIIVGIFMIPALYAMAAALFGTVMAFFANPELMTIILGALAILSLPGMLIIAFIKR